MTATSVITLSAFRVCFKNIMNFNYGFEINSPPLTGFKIGADVCEQVKPLFRMGKVQSIPLKCLIGILQCTKFVELGGIFLVEVPCFILNV